jgi:hypothetical protein
MTTEIAVRRDDHDDLFRIARAFAESGYFKDSKDEAQAVVRILAGRELGFGAFASMSGIHIIEGKPAVSAGLMATAIENSGRYAYHLAWEPNDRDVTGCAITFYRLHTGGKGGRTELGVSRFSIEDARAAGLWDRAMWKRYTRNMLFSRAMSNGCRWYCAGVFGVGAVYTPEELGADVDADGAPINPPAPVLHMVATPTDLPMARQAVPPWPDLPPRAPVVQPARERSRNPAEGKRWSESQLAWFWASLGDLQPRVTRGELHAILGVDSIHDWPDLDEALRKVRKTRMRLERAADDSPVVADMPSDMPSDMPTPMPADERDRILAKLDDDAPEDEDEESLGSVLLHPDGSIEAAWQRYAAVRSLAMAWNRDYPEQPLKWPEPPRDGTAAQVRATAEGLERRLAKLHGLAYAP